MGKVLIVQVYFGFRYSGFGFGDNLNRFFEAGHNL